MNNVLVLKVESTTESIKFSVDQDYALGLALNRKSTPYVWIIGSFG